MSILTTTLMGSSTTVSTFGSRLERAVDASALSQAELAARADTSPKTVGRYLDRERPPDVNRRDVRKIVERIAAVLEVNSDWLLTGEGEAEAGASEAGASEAGASEAGASKATEASDTEASSAASDETDGPRRSREPFGCRLKELQKSKAGSVTEFAGELGVSRQTVYDWFKLDEPTKKAVGAVVSAYPEVNVHWLRGEDPLAQSQPSVSSLYGDHVQVGVVIGSAGDGAEPGRTETMLIPAERYERDFRRTAPSDGVSGDWYVRVEGESMVPEFFSGEELPVELFDGSLGDLHSSGLYVVLWEGTVHLRRVDIRTSGTIRLVCTNPNYENQLVSEEDKDSIRVLAEVTLSERDAMVGAFMKTIVD